eukprot:6035499-Amphidinium_carterae.2
MATIAGWHYLPGTAVSAQNASDNAHSVANAAHAEKLVGEAISDTALAHYTPPTCGIGVSRETCMSPVPQHLRLSVRATGAIHASCP